MVTSVEFVLQKQVDAQQRGVLSLWTIYDHPTDFPETPFVARRFEMDKPTDDILGAKDVEILRDLFDKAGLVKLMRNEGDDAKIMETWV